LNFSGFKRRLDESANEWHNQKHPDGLLWRSPYLEQLEEFYGKYSDEMNAIEIEFFRTSVESKEEAIRREREYIQKIENERNRAQSLLAKNYWSTAVNEKKTNNLVKSLHYMAKSAQEEPKAVAIKNNIFNIQNTGKTFLASQFYHDAYINGAIFNKDESLILSWIADNTVRLWNAKDGSLTAHMKYDYSSSVDGAKFNKDESLILSWGNTVRLWNIAVDYDFPNEHLPLMVNVMTGTKMDDYGNLTVLTKDEWEAQKAEYIKVAEEHLKSCKYKSGNLYLRQKEYWGQ